MTEGTDIDSDVLSREGTETLLRLLAGADRSRLSRAQIDGRIVWIKRFDGKVKALPKRLHLWLSPLLPLVMRSCSARSGRQALRREVRKSANFRAGGFLTPQTVFRNDMVLVMSDVGRIVEHAMSSLKRTDSRAHDELLVEMAGALGRAHAQGLCHGRPHPRDIFVSGGQWGFLDFEEEPEAIMPLATAQARDIAVLFMQITRHALLADTPARAFSAYRAQAPATIIPELRRIVASLSFLLPGLRLLRPFGLGNDGRAILESLSFMRKALSEPTNKTHNGSEIRKTT